MLATSPDNVPQNGVRTPRGSSASCRRCQVQPASTVTTMSSVSTSSTRFIAPRSMQIAGSSGQT